ncbi:MAG TPA: SRPBCC domain-containing protein [Acidimicrobiales bacterium]
MTTPDIPYRVEFAVEVPGTPEQVWSAIATGAGISSWFLPTDVDERAGGRIVTHMGETSSPGRVTAWEPPHRFAYEEPEWAGLGGHPDAEVAPLASEFLVEARSRGTCVVRVVSSAFGTGADWEREFFEDMERYWRPFFEHQLRWYLADFAGQRATTHTVEVLLPAPPERVQQEMARALGVTAAGQPVEALGLRGRVERAGDPYLTMRADHPQPGYLGLFASPHDSGGAVAQISAWLFGDGAPGFVEREAPAWQAWLEGLAVGEAPATRR